MITYQRFMIGAHLRQSTYHATPCSDHEHCTMCGVKFSESSKELQHGYVTLDGRHWVCKECLNDYKEEYDWILENP